MILLPKFDRHLNAVLERRSSFAALDGLIAALDGSPSEVDFGRTAIVLDTSAILRLPNMRATDDIVDYLRTKHTAPVVLPGQAIQEFWNNHGDFIRTAAANLRQKVTDLQTAIDTLGSDLADFGERLGGIVDEFETAHGNLYDEGVARKTRTVLNALKEKAVVGYANRAHFHKFAEQRQKTRTPPGFKDASDGDFYLWLDALAGLYEARSKRSRFDAVALVSMDKKKDWLSNNVPHPILSAEIDAMFGAQFSVWDLNRLVREVSAAL